jgi:uncharacterized protein (UPF0212 family)
MSERAACPRLFSSDIVASSKSFSSLLLSFTYYNINSFSGMSERAACPHLFSSDIVASSKSFSSLLLSSIYYNINSSSGMSERAACPRLFSSDIVASSKSLSSLLLSFTYYNINSSSGMSERAACPRLLASDIMLWLVVCLLSCCRCLCFRCSSLCPPLSKELYVGTIPVLYGRRRTRTQLLEEDTLSTPRTSIPGNLTDARKVTKHGKPQQSTSRESCDQQPIDLCAFHDLRTVRKSYSNMEQVWSPLYLNKASHSSR